MPTKSAVSNISKNIMLFFTPARVRLDHEKIGSLYVIARCPKQINLTIHHIKTLIQKISQGVPYCYKAPFPFFLKLTFRYPENKEISIIYTIQAFRISIPAQADRLLRFTNVLVSMPVPFHLDM